MKLKNSFTVINKLSVWTTSLNKTKICNKTFMEIFFFIAWLSILSWVGGGAGERWRRHWLVVLWKVSLWSRGQTTPNTLALSCHACICIQQCISFVQLSSMTFNIVYKHIGNSNKTVWNTFFISLQADVWWLLGNSENYQCLMYESMSGKLRLSASAGC